MKRKILLISLGMLLGSLITVGAATLFNSNQVLYTSDTTVEDALNDLYTRISIGNATASDIKSGKTALVGGKQVTGSLSLTSLSGTQSVNAGSSSTTLNGNYSLSNYKVSCATCPSYTNLSGTQSVAAGSSSSTLNGLYNMSNYKVSCGTNSCPSCNSCCSGYNAPRTVLNRTYSGTGNVENLGYKPTLIVLKMNKGSSYDTTTYFENIDSSTIWDGGSKRTIGASNCWLQAISSTGFTWRTTSGTSYSGASVTFYIW